MSNAKDLFRMTEADSPVPPEHPLGVPPRGRRKADPETFAALPGAERKGQFNPKELSQLKDVVILILASMARSDLDLQIGQALATGKDLDPGQLQHILDEARNAPIPESHGPLMQKIFNQLSQSW